MYIIFPWKPFSIVFWLHVAVGKSEAIVVSHCWVWFILTSTFLPSLLMSNLSLLQLYWNFTTIYLIWFCFHSHAGPLGGSFDLEPMPFNLRNFSWITSFPFSLFLYFFNCYYLALGSPDSELMFLSWSSLLLHHLPVFLLSFGENFSTLLVSSISIDFFLLTSSYF